MTTGGAEEVEEQIEMRPDSNRARDRKSSHRRRRSSIPRRNSGSGKEKPIPLSKEMEVEMTQEEYVEVMRLKRLRGLLYRPEYAHGDDGMDDMMPTEVPMCEVQERYSRAKPTWRRISDARKSKLGILVDCECYITKYHQRSKRWKSTEMAIEHI